MLWGEIRGILSLEKSDVVLSGTQERERVGTLGQSRSKERNAHGPDKGKRGTR